MTFLFDLLFFKFARVSIINLVRELVVDIYMSKLVGINVKCEKYSLSAATPSGNLSLYDFDDILQRRGIIMPKLLTRIYH